MYTNAYSLQSTLSFFLFNSSKPSTSAQSIERDNSAGVLGKLADISVYDNPSTCNVQSSDDIEPIRRQGRSGMK